MGKSHSDLVSSHGFGMRAWLPRYSAVWILGCLAAWLAALPVGYFPGRSEVRRRGVLMHSRFGKSNQGPKTSRCTAAKGVQN